MKKTVKNQNGGFPLIVGYDSLTAFKRAVQAMKDFGKTCKKCIGSHE